MVGSRGFFPALLCVLSIVLCPAVDAQQRALDAAQVLARTPLPAMHMALGAPVLVDVRLQADIDAPKLEAKRWQFVVAGPATVSGQRVVSVDLVPAGKQVQDRSVWLRPLLIGELDAGKRQRQRATSIWSMRVELRSRRLTEGADSDPVAALPVAERAAALAVNTISDWTSDAFQSGLDTAGLRPHAGEHALAFARRVLRHVRSLHYAYTNDLDRCASAVLATGASDCGGLGGLTVATLRAAGIPARLLVGRWAKSADPAEKLEGLSYRQWHVKLEFHLDGLGWIPADAAVGMNDPGAWFGLQNADFVVMHVDPVVKIDTFFGVREL
ncbi:MAG TPA: transglutaminase-like domain-containing protein, partial [Planctomycetota bacterium]|nr:transglutaminase-like domain-containing protein [Planctomycetota bacterium]